MPIIESFERRCGDIDRLLSYTTSKRVVIQDRFLGALSTLLRLSSLVYIVTIVVIEKAYYVVDHPTGTTRLSLHIPDATDKELPYCTNSPHGGPFVYQPWRALPCLFMDRHQLHVPSLGHHIFVTTRIVRHMRKYDCVLGNVDGNGIPCTKLQAHDATPLFAGFVGGVEDATILLSHTVEGRGRVKIQQDITDMDGTFVDCKGDVVKRMPRKSKHATVSEDIPNRIVSVSDLLSWASNMHGGSCDHKISLEDYSFIDPDKRSSLRYDGLLVYVIIEYDNTKGNTDEVSYTMSATAITTADPKYEVLSRINATHHEHDNRHGVYIVVVQTGRLASFSFPALAMSLTSIMGLWMVADRLTVFLASYVMPRRKEYKDVLYEYSDDFSDLRARGKSRSWAPPFEDPPPPPGGGGSVEKGGGEGDGYDNPPSPPAYPPCARGVFELEMNEECVKGKLCENEE